LASYIGSNNIQGLALWVSVNKATIIGNTFENNRASDDSYGYNISIEDSAFNKDITIVGNLFIQNIGQFLVGVRLASSPINIIIEGNTFAIEGTGASPVSYPGGKPATAIVRNNTGYTTENSGTATLGGGTMTDGTGVVTGSPVTLAPGANTPTITQAGTFTINLPAGNTGTAASGGWTVTDSPVALVAGDNVITVEAGGGGTITVTTASTTMTVTHGLATTPTRAQATMTSDPGAANAHWVSGKGVTTFKINTKVAVSTQTTFDWHAVVGEGN